MQQAPGRPGTPDVPHMALLVPRLHEALALEHKYQPSLQLPLEAQDNGEITVGTRDGAAHVLRCLKVWYDMPPDVLFAAINLVDRFLTKMKVKPKHMACISVGSLSLATQQLGLQEIDQDDLVMISQCKCTPGDLTRMAGIVANKLGVAPNTEPVTALTFLRLFSNMFKDMAMQHGVLDAYNELISEGDLIMRLEIIACDSTCSSIRASELALVLFCTQLESAVNNLDNPNGQKLLSLVEFAYDLQRVCNIPDESFYRCHSCIVNILSRYNNQGKNPHRQRLVWRLSSRTLKLLRPTDRLTTVLPTIAEHGAQPRLRLSIAGRGAPVRKTVRRLRAGQAAPSFRSACNAERLSNHHQSSSGHTHSRMTSIGESLGMISQASTSGKKLE